MEREVNTGAWLQVFLVCNPSRSKNIGFYFYSISHLNVRDAVEVRAWEDRFLSYNTLKVG